MYLWSFNSSIITKIVCIIISQKEKLGLPDYLGISRIHLVFNILIFTVNILICDSLYLIKCNIHVISVLCLLCFRVRLFIDALWSPAGEGLTSWFSFVMSNCEFFTFPLVYWVRCGT